MIRLSNDIATGWRCKTQTETIHRVYRWSYPPGLRVQKCNRWAETQWTESVKRKKEKKVKGINKTELYIFMLQQRKSENHSVCLSCWWKMFLFYEMWIFYPAQTHPLVKLLKSYKKVQFKWPSRLELCEQHCFQLYFPFCEAFLLMVTRPPAFWPTASGKSTGMETTGFTMFIWFMGDPAEQLFASVCEGVSGMKMILMRLDKQHLLACMLLLKAAREYRCWSYTVLCVLMGV